MIVDLIGIPKDRYYLYRSYWRPETTTIHILPHWNWPDHVGTKVPVFVYTNGDSAELFLNGKSLGRRTKGEAPGKPVNLARGKTAAASSGQADASNADYYDVTYRYRLRWNDVVYEPGELKAVAYKGRTQIGETAIRTAGRPARIRLTPDRTKLSATGEDLSYILVEALDEQGALCPLADNLVRFDVEGPAEIAGVGNGDQLSLEPFQADYRKLFFGKAILILRTVEGQTGKIQVAARSEGMQPGTTTLSSSR